MIDVVYILGPGSHWQNHELRFSLRSVEKNLIGYRNIFIVGFKPDWCHCEPVSDGRGNPRSNPNAPHCHCEPRPCVQERDEPDSRGRGNLKLEPHSLFHIPADDVSDNADGNMADKTMIACKDPRISNTFLYIHDDHFFIQPIRINRIKHYSKGLLEQCNRANDPFSVLYTTEYSERIRNTIEYLRRHGLPTNNFDGHYPMLINKRKFIRAFKQIDYLKGKYIVKSLYGNINRLKTEYLKDCKIERPHSARQIMSMTEGRWIFSIGDRALKTDGLKDFLALSFPQKSRFETDICPPL